MLSISCVFGQSFDVVNVDEATPIGSTVHSLPTPSSNQDYTMYEYGDPDALTLFSISEKGEISTKTKLDYVIGEINSYYIIAILRNKGKNYGGQAFTRRMDIKDSNDHSPKFAKSIYNGYILEGIPAGTVVSGLEDCFATDEDESGILDYTITEGNNNNQFKLEVKDVNGIQLLVVKTTGTLDRDEIRAAPHLDLGVRANDGGIGDQQKFAKTVIRINIIDINDNPPVFVFPNWQQTIQENAQVMTSVMKVTASDNDAGLNSDLYYYFQDLVEDLYINPSTGVIYVAKNLNFDSARTYKLTVIAQDKSISSTPRSASTPVNIDVLNVQNYPPPQSKISFLTNSGPKFTKALFTVTIRGDLPQRAFVFHAHASHANGVNAQLKYTLSGSGASMFHIAPTSGVVTLAGRLTKGTATKYQLSIKVQDGDGKTSTSTLKVNVQPLNLNVHKPVFSPSTVRVEVAEDINTNTEIGFTVRAIDQDSGTNGKVEYSIVGGSGMGMFRVDKETGTLTSRRPFSSAGMFDLYIRGSDTGNYRQMSTMYMQIKVKSSHKMHAVLSQAMYIATIAENEPSGSFVGAIFAKSPGPSMKVFYKIGGVGISRGIALDVETGVITTTQSLDYELESQKTIEIEISVAGTTLLSKTLLQVNIINLNDNPPVFTRSSITIHVKENSGHIPSLACMFANDMDGTDKNTLQYSIKSGNIGNKFSIDGKTGKSWFPDTVE